MKIKTVSQLRLQKKALKVAQKLVSDHFGEEYPAVMLDDEKDMVFCAQEGFLAAHRVFQKELKEYEDKAYELEQQLKQEKKNWEVCHNRWIRAQEAIKELTQMKAESAGEK